MGEPLTPTAFVRKMRPALRQAAAIARALEGRVTNEPKRGETRAAKAALTIADTAAQEAILVPLFERWPEVCIEAEEDTETASHFPRSGPAQVVVDPIDGTLYSYLGRRGPYAVMAGLAVDGRYEGALVALPREGLCLDASRGGGACLSVGDRPPRPARCDGAGSRVLVSPELPQAILDALCTAGLEPKAASGGAIAVAPALPGVRAGLWP
jgi:fructose-1,6-bisphosphatase/inositol monophosphatase family enzyme